MSDAYDALLREAEGRPFAAIVGWPVDHSRSPALHGFWLKQHRIDAHYGRLPVEPNRAALERLVGKQALELELLKGGLRNARSARSGPMSAIVGPKASLSPKDAG